MNKSVIPLGLCAVLFFLFPSLARPAEIDPKLQSIIAHADPQEAVPIIVTFNDEPELKALPEGKKERRAMVVKTLRQKAESVQAPVRALLHARGKRFESLWIVNGLALRAAPELIDLLAAQPHIERIEYDALIQLPEVLPAQEADAEWNISAVRAPELWELGFSGQGVTIAFLDSGVNVNHPDLVGRYRGGPAGWYDPYRQTTAPYDPAGHGTMVAGVAVGGSASGTAIGVAPGARWIAAKIFRDDGVAENSQIFKAFQWLLDPDGNPETADAVTDVVNNSWGFEEAPGACDTLFRPAIQNLKAAGMAVVFAAGNTGPGAGVSPGNYPESFAVGATNRSSLLAPFSARGPSACDGTIFPELVAPGEKIRSTAPFGYTVVSGTSFSAPHVAGVMALLLSVAPTLPVGELERILQVSANDLGLAPGPDNEYGYGLVNALAAFQLLSGAPDISVHDTSLPADDLTFDFGHIPPGQTASLTATVRNAGEGILQISGIGSVQPPFTLAANDCLGRALAAGQSCALVVRFDPPELAAYTDTLRIDSSDPDQGVISLRLIGVGNTPPPAPQLVFPEDGASGVAVPVSLEWTQRSDIEGDDIRHFVLMSERSDFSDSIPQQVTAHAGRRGALLAGAGGLLLFALAASRSKRRALSLTLLAAAIILLVACNGGDSDNNVVEQKPLPPGDLVSETVADLAANTRYYWKIVAEDARGAKVESEVFNFVTRP
jgi:hypothetical protein